MGLYHKSSINRIASVNRYSMKLLLNQTQFELNELNHCQAYSNTSTVSFTWSAGLQQVLKFKMLSVFFCYMFQKSY